MARQNEQACVALFYKALSDTAARQEFAASLPFFIRPNDDAADENKRALTEFLVANLDTFFPWVTQCVSRPHMWRARIVVEYLSSIRGQVESHMQTMQTVATAPPPDTPRTANP